MLLHIYANWCSIRVSQLMRLFMPLPLHPLATLSVEEPNDLSSHVLSPRLLVVHDPGRRGKHNVPKLTRRQQLHDPLLEIGQADIIPRADDAGLVQPVKASGFIAMGAIHGAHRPLS